MRFSSIWLAPLVAVFSLSAQAPSSTPSTNPTTNQGATATPASQHAHESQGMPPRAAPTDYPTQMKVGPVTIAVEFTGHSIARPEGPLSTSDYVVIEAGLFGPPDSHVAISRNDFTLKINGKKKPLDSEAYELVDHSLKDPAWEPPEKKEDKPKTSFGSGGGSNDSLPVIVHVPIELQRAMAQYIERSALPDGDRPLPKAGLLFFPYRGTDKSIHSIELIYSGPLGKASAELQP